MTLSPRYKFVLLLMFALVVPFFIYPIFLAKVLCYGLLACSFNFMFSRSGLLSFGHAAFWGLGAYSAAFLLKASFSFEVALAITLLVVFGYALILGFCSIKRQGIYFSMVTLAFAQMFYFLALKSPWTSGEDGIQGVPRLSVLSSFVDFESARATYYFTLFFVGIAFALLLYLRKTKFSFALGAIQQNPVRALSLGTNIHRQKIIALVISGLLSGLAGALKVFILGQATIEDFTWHLSGAIILMALLGGVESFWGPFFGAVLLLGIQDQLAGLGSWIFIIQGVVFILCVLFLPKGLSSFGE